MRYLLILLSTILIIGCSSVAKEYLTNDDACHYNDPIFKVTKEEKYFSINTFFDTIKRQTKVIEDNSVKNIRYIMWKNGNITNKQTNKQSGISRWIDYRKSGEIKNIEYRYLNGDSNIYKETHYDEQGNITKVIDYEKGYKICWTEAIEIVKQIAKKDIEKYQVTGYNIRRVDLNKFPNEKPEWGISLDGNEEYELKHTKVYWIDGVTGKFLRTTKIIMTHD